MALEYRVMSDQKQSDGGPEEQGSIFGKLPNARPGVRSPRRAAAKAREPQAARARPPRRSAPKARPSPTGSGRGTPSPPRPRRPEPEAAAQGRGGGGVEDVAWAGITVAAEAATLGVRLLSRAVEAVRKPADRP